MTRLCSFDACERKHYGQGFCKSHYQKFARTGSPLGSVRKAPEDRFWPKVDKSGNCWVWTAGKNIAGYGSFTAFGRPVSAHRYSYEINVGPIPDRHDIDHTCHNRVCVNPAHLRATTRKQNIENQVGAQSRSRTGVRGVTPVRTKGKWRADVGHFGAQHYLGVFDSIAEAEAAVIAKRNELFTHNDADRKAS